MDWQSGREFMHGRKRKAAAKRRIDSGDAQGKRRFHPGQRRGIGLDLCDLMPEFLQCSGPDGLHGIVLRMFAICSIDSASASRSQAYRIHMKLQILKSYRWRSVSLTTTYPSQRQEAIARARASFASPFRLSMIKPSYPLAAAAHQSLDDFPRNPGTNFPSCMPLSAFP